MSQETTKGPWYHETAIIDDDVEIGDGTKIWHFSHILNGSRIGRNCALGQNTMVGPKVTIGTGVKVQNNISIYEGVTIEDDVFLGPSMVFTNVMTPRAFINRKSEFLPTLIRRGASIGANATIVCGVRVGQYALVGAGSVVTRNVQDYALVVGSPAKKIGWVSREGERLGADLICPRTNEKYIETENGLEPSNRII
jgi:UDP-2-acetamido-3-amino-2,3-dideoxy-glucuronate N-acetyltransferase